MRIHNWRQLLVHHALWSLISYLNISSACSTFSTTRQATFWGVCFRGWISSLTTSRKNNTPFFLSRTNSNSNDIRKCWCDKTPYNPLSIHFFSDMPIQTTWQIYCLSSYDSSICFPKLFTRFHFFQYYVQISIPTYLRVTPKYIYLI